MAANAERAALLGAPGIDLNFGCPAKTVRHSQCGAPLIRSPDLIRSISERVQERVPHGTAVTAKIRLGYDTDENFEEILDALAAVAITEVTIHARTRRQGYRPQAHWHRLRDARNRLPFPVIANGELWTLGDIARCAEVSGSRAFMAGRGALCRPDLGAAIEAFYRGEAPSAFDWQQARELLIHTLEQQASL